MLAEADLGPITSEADENMDLDFFDRQDLGRLRRRLRKGIEGFQRERELYLELVHEFLKVQISCCKALSSRQSNKGLLAGDYPLSECWCR